MIEQMRRLATYIKIETYWNVNNFTVATNAKEFKIKIETYWNVNAREVVEIFTPNLLK